MYIVLLYFKDQTETVLSEMTIKQPFYIIHHIIMYVQVTCSDPDFLEAAKTSLIKLLIINQCRQFELKWYNMINW